MWHLTLLRFYISLKEVKGPVQAYLVKYVEPRSSSQVTLNQVVSETLYYLG